MNEFRREFENGTSDMIQKMSYCFEIVLCLDIRDVKPALVNRYATLYKEKYNK